MVSNLSRGSGGCLINAGLVSLNDVEIISPENPFLWVNQSDFGDVIYSLLNIEPIESINVQRLESKNAGACSEALDYIFNMETHPQGL